MLPILKASQQTNRDDFSRKKPNFSKNATSLTQPGEQTHVKKNLKHAALCQVTPRFSFVSFLAFFFRARLALFILLGTKQNCFEDKPREKTASSFRYDPQLEAVC